MLWHTITLNNVAPEPWRNGGGETQTLLAWPLNRKQWLMRISVAQIAKDGAFSPFHGVERAFAVLSGQGVWLDAQEIKPQQTLYFFDGASAPYCRLQQEATSDLNFMWHKERIEAVAEPRLGWACAVYEHGKGALHFTETLTDLALPHGEYVMSWRLK